MPPSTSCGRASRTSNSSPTRLRRSADRKHRLRSRRASSPPSSIGCASRYPRMVFHVVADGSRAATSESGRTPRRSPDLSQSSAPLRTSNRASSSFSKARMWWRRAPRARGSGGVALRSRELIGEMWALPAPNDAFGSFVVDAFRASGLAVPARDRGRHRSRNARQSVADRPLSLDHPGVLAAIPRPASLHQKVAGRIAGRQRTDRDRHAEKSHARARQRGSSWTVLAKWLGRLTRSHA